MVGVGGRPRIQTIAALLLLLLAEQRLRVLFLGGDLGVRRHGNFSYCGGLKPSVPQVTAHCRIHAALGMQTRPA